MGISEKAQESRDWLSKRQAGVCTGRIGGCPVLGLSTTGGESSTSDMPLMSLDFHSNGNTQNLGRA